MLSDDRTDFTAFGLVHGAMLAVFVVVAVCLVFLGRRQRGTGREVVFARAFAVVIPLFTVPLQLIQFLPGEWNLTTSLPLQICDFAWVVAIYALWTRRRWAVTVNWLWGMTLTIQGMLTPDLGSGWGEPRFWMFWIMHWLVVWSAVYLAWGLRIVPRWRDFGVTVAITLVWAVSVMTFNAVVGTNYGYLNGKPNGASALDLLGPWPGYVVVEVTVIVVVWALMTWAWTSRPDQARARREPSRASE